MPAAPAACPLPSSRPLVLARMGAAFSAPRSRGQGWCTGGAAVSQVVAHPPVGCYACLSQRDAKGGGCAAPASVPCWDVNEAPVYTQTGA